MSDLVVTGPPVLELRWGQTAREEEGRTIRDFYPERRFQEPRGYLHGGIAAASVLGAARLTGHDTEPPTSVAVSLGSPTPLGVPLRALAGTTDDGGAEVRVEHVRRVEAEEDIYAPTFRGTARFAGYEEAPDIADVRQLATVPIPEPEEHDLFAGCYVCGQANPEGLQLLPGWHAPGRVVVSFVPDERFVEGARKGRVPALVLPALLSCPTLWACREQLDATGRAGALLRTFEIRFHEEIRVSTVLRAVGWAGEPDGDDLRAASALVDEDGRIYATASASWRAVDDVPARDPDREPPLREEMPAKAGRPENRSDDDWGKPLPGRREEPGPRSARPGERA
jgi:hypothetical protein